MRSSFDARSLLEKGRRAFRPGAARDARAVTRAALGVLLLANLVAAFFVIRPLGGSAEELQARLVEYEQQARQRRAHLETLRKLSGKIEKGRAQGDAFLDRYFLERRSAYSTVISELAAMAKAAGVRPKEHTYEEEPVEGSDTLAMLTINGHVEASYADLIQFMNQLDRAPRLLIVESLAASPQPASGALNVNIKINAFVREAPAPGGAQIAAAALSQGGAK